MKIGNYIAVFLLSFALAADVDSVAISGLPNFSTLNSANEIIITATGDNPTGQAVELNFVSGNGSISFPNGNTTGLGGTINALVTFTSAATSSITASCNNVTSSELTSFVEIPKPTTPVITWINSANLNTTDNQTIRVYRPNTIANIEQWEISNITTNVPISLDYVDVSAISDNQTITITVAWIDSETSLHSASSDPVTLDILDRTPPLISDITTTSAIDGQLDFNVTDFDTLSIQVNDVTKTTADVLNVAYNQVMKITINAQDDAGNYTITTLSYITDTAPTPDMPTLSWIDAGINSTDNQTVRVSRPATINYIEEWEIVGITSNIPVSLEYVDIYPVSDNQTVTLAVAWIDTDTNSHSGSSAMASQIITDRTPPLFNSFNPANNETNVPTSAELVISVSDVDTSVATVSVFGVNGSLNFDGTTITFNPSNDFYYGDTVQITVNIADSENNTATAEYKFYVHPDVITPAIENIVYSTEISTNLEFKVSDPETGVNWSSLQLLVNNEDKTLELVTSDEQVTYNPSADFAYGQLINVTINVRDVSGNLATNTFSFTTDIPDAPDKPTLNWVDDGTNSTDNQTVRVFRPATINYIEEWEIVGITSNIPVSVEYVDLYPVSDNQTVTIAVAWIDTDTNSHSNSSAVATQVIADRTAPLFTGFTPIHNATDVPTSTTLVIAVTDADTTVTTTSVLISANGILSFNGTTITFNPTTDFYYGETVYVTINIQDAENNSTTTAYKFDIHNDVINPAISNIITSDSTINPSLYFSVSDTETGISWNSLSFVFAGTDKTLDLVTSDERITFDSVITFNYGQTIPVTISVSDVSGNANTITFSYQTINPPTPSQPTLTWIDGGINSTDNQTIRVTRPATINYIEQWEITDIVSGLSVETEYYDILNVSDNQTVTYSIAWIDTDTNSHSDSSEPVTISITDRTPPYYVSSYPIQYATDIPTAATFIININDDHNLISVNSLVFTISTDNSTTLDGSLEFDGQTITFNPTNDLYYGDRVFVTFNYTDLENNTTTTAYSFDIHKDILAPVINSLDYSNQIFTNINFKVTDTETGISWNTLQVLVNSIDRTAELITSDAQITYNPTADFYYGQLINVEINIQDVSGNLATNQFNFTTVQPDAAEQPTLTWLDNGLNSGDTQTIRITRPATINYIEAWEVSYVSGNGMHLTTNIPVSVSYVDISPVSDNQTVFASVAWIDTDTNSHSNSSAFDSVLIDDRTAPVYNNFYPNHDASDIPTSSVLVITVSDAETNVATASILASVTGTLVFDGTTITFNPTNNLYYGDTIFVTLNIADPENNSTNVSYKFYVHNDIIIPTIDNIINNTEISTNINFRVTDAETGISWNSLQLLVNNIDRSAELITSDEQVTYNPSADFAYGQLINVTINVKDVSGNLAVNTFSFTTDIPAAPDKPTLNWVDGGINSTDNQTIRVFRPATINYIEEWEVSIAQGNGMYTTTNIPVSVNYVDLYPISDNQTVTAAVAWIDTEFNSHSNSSPENTQLITDRTPPYYVSSYPIQSGTDIPTAATFVININDDHNLISINSLVFTISTDNATTLDGILEFDGLAITFNPTNDLYYGDRVFVTFNYTDLEENTTTTNYYFNIHNDIIIPTIDSIIHNTEISTNINFRVTDAETGIDWNTIELWVNGNDETSYLVTSDEQVTYNPTNDFSYGQLISVTINIKDVSGNLAINTFSFTTDIPPAPDKPTLDWVDSGVNSTDNQTIRVFRPTTISYIEEWEVSIAQGNGMYTTTNIPVSVNYVDLFPIADNQTVTVAVAWIDTEYNSHSNSSEVNTQLITDRTPPYYVSSYPVQAGTDIPTAATFVININDDHNLISINSLVFTISTDNATTIDGSIEFDGTIITFNPTNDLYYGDRVFVTINYTDIENNTTTTSYYFNIHNDIIVPTIDNIVTNSAIDANIYFRVTDAETGIDWNTLIITINGENRPHTISTSNTNVTYNPAIDFNYGQQISVTLSVCDISGNNTIATFDYITDIPPAPDKPTLNWVDGGINSTDNQTIRVFRPATINYIEEWEVSIAQGNGMYTTTNIPVSVNYVDLYPIADNQTVTVAVAWIDTEYNSHSNSSVTNTQLITDRTPPEYNSFLPNNNDSDVPTYSNLAITVSDQHNAVTTATAQLSTNNIDSLNYALTFDGNNLTINPTDDFYYGETIFVTINIVDAENNNTTTSYKFFVHQDTIIPTIDTISYDTTITTNIYFRVTDAETGISWNTLQLLVNNIERTAELITSDAQITYNPTNDFSYGQLISVTINVKDVSGNLATNTFSFTTDIPAAPNKPTLNWVDSGVNSTDNQTVRVFRPDTIDYIEEWEVSIAQGNGMYTTTNIPVSVGYVDLYPISDNQTVTVAVAWIDTEYNSHSNSSAVNTQLITNRTPPMINALIPEINSTNVTVSDNISFYMYDANQAVNTASLTIVVDGYSYSGGQINFSGQPDNTLAILNIPYNLEYNATIPVTINFRDIEDNSVTLAYSFQTVIDITKPVIRAISPNNLAQHVSSPVTISYILEDFISGVSINSLSFNFDGQIIPNNSLTITPITDGYFVTYRPTIDFWTTFNLTINIEDIAHNSHQATSSFKTTTTNIHDLNNDRYYRTIGEALQRSPAGITLALIPATYYESNLARTKDITIQPTDQSRVTIDANGTGRVLNISGANVTLNKLTLLNGQSDSQGGGAILATGTNQIQLFNCLVSGNNSSNDGGAIMVASGTTTLNSTDSTFSNNKANLNGGAIAKTDVANLSSYIYRNNFIGNKALNNGGVNSKGYFKAFQSVFTNNNATYESALSYQGNQVFENCTIYNNTASSYTVSKLNSGESVLFTNTIIWNNGAHLFANTSDPAILLLKNCNVQTYAYSYPSENCLSSAPAFQNASGLNFNLKPGDADIDKGTTNITNSLSFVYDKPDIGASEYSSIYISNINPENNSTNVSVLTPISLLIRDNSSLINSANIKVVLNNKTYTSSSMNIIDSSTATSADLAITIPNPGFAYSATITLSISATNNLGENQTLATQFSTQATYLDRLSFSSSSLNISAEASYNIGLTAYDSLNNPMSGQLVNFSIISKTPVTNNSTLSSITTVTTDAQGKANVSINISSENATIIVGANSGAITAQPLTVNVAGLIRFTKNIRLNKTYLYINDAFTDSALTKNDTIYVDSTYSNAAPNQKTGQINWPNIDNITLTGEKVSTNFNILISGTSINLTISSLNFSSATNSAVNISNSPSSNLNIINCIFSNNAGSAIRTNQINQLVIIGSRFDNNIGTNGGAINLTALNAPTFISKQNIFEYNNATGFGSAIYINASQAKAIIENSLIVSNNNNNAIDLSLSQTTINYCTIADNTQGLNLRSGQAKVLNSIIWNKTDIVNSGTLTLQDTIVSDNAFNGTNVTYTDPQLSSNYSVAFTSPAINKGDGPAVTTDVYGTTRPQWGNYDLGAVEFTTTQSIYLVGKGYYATIQNALDAAIANDIIELNETNFNISTPLIWPNQNNLTLRGHNYASSKNILIKTNGVPLIYQNNNVNLSISNLTIASANNALIVSSNGVINLTTINILDCYAPESATQSGSIIYSRKPITININNGYLVNNKSYSSGGLFYTAQGISELIMTNTVITSASSETGKGGIAVNVSANLQNVTASNYVGYAGGGAFYNANLTIAKSTFLNGLANGLDGGAFANNSTVNAQSSLFKDHYAWFKGGVFSNSVITLNNCILYGNNAVENNTAVADSSSHLYINNSVLWANIGGAITYDIAKTIINYSDTDNNYPGTGNFNLDPKFISPNINNFAVTYNSPLIDTGSGASYIYDQKDIGISEYPDTFISHLSPMPSGTTANVTDNIKFRIRNSIRVINPSSLAFSVNTINYTYPTANLTITNNNSGVSTDLWVELTTTPDFKYLSTITVNIKIDNVNYIYNFKTKTPENIYVSNSGNDTTNDGSRNYPFQTIAKAFTIARDKSNIILASGNYSENVSWTNYPDITLIGTINSTIIGNIQVNTAITANIKQINLKGTISNSNSSKLFIDSITATGNSLAINNSATLYLNNSVLAYNTTAINNTGIANIYFSNLVSNNLAFQNGGTLTAINNILWNNQTINDQPINLISCLTNIDPLFTDSSLKEIAFNSPAIDTATLDISVSTDIRAMLRPQHYAMDIGAYESAKPNIIMASQNILTTPITTNFIFEVIDNDVVTNSISLSISGNYQFTATTRAIQVIFTPTYFFDTNTTYNLSLSAGDVSGNISTMNYQFHTQADFTELYVDSAASGNINQVGLAQYPYSKIQNALTYISTKNLLTTTINIQSGTYKENLYASANTGAILRQITITANNAIIDGQSLGHTFQIGTSHNISIRGLTIRNAAGSGISANRSIIVLADSTIEKNTGTIGSGIYFDNIQATLNNLIISSNAGSNGGGIYLKNSKIRISSSLITGNTASTSGGGIYIDNISVVTINKTIIRGNRGNNGGGVYNAGSVWAINSIIDLNNASNSGGGHFNFTSGRAYFYNTNVISNNATSFGGGIAHYNSNSSTLILNNVLFHKNTGGNSVNKTGPNVDHQASFSGASMIISGTWPSSLVSQINIPTIDPKFVEESEQNYRLMAESLCKDAGVNNSYALDDLDNNLRSGTFDIGAYEFVAGGLLIPTDTGYEAYDEFGNINGNIIPTATVTITRTLNSLFAGSITIPSSNGLDLSNYSLRNLIITSNLISIPSNSILATNNYVYQIILPSTKYPFLSASGTLNTDYLAHTVIYESGTYKLTTSLTGTGSFTIVTANKLNFLTPAINDNHGKRSLISLATYHNNILLQNVPVTINISSNGVLDTNPITQNTYFTHGASTEAIIITANFEDLITTLSVKTYVDDQAPTITILMPTNTENVAVTTNIKFSITDNLSGINTTNLIMKLDNVDISSEVSVNGSEYTYSKRLIDGHNYSLELQAVDLGGNTNNVVYDFATKLDTDKPAILNIKPAQNATQVLPTAPFILNLSDLESGLDFSSLVIQIKGSDILSTSQITTTDYSLQVTFNPIVSYGLLETVPVTVSIQDLRGNQLILTYNFEITEDIFTPTINVLSPANGSINNNYAASINFLVSDTGSGVNTKNIELWVNNNLINTANLSITPDLSTANSWQVSYQPTRLGFNQNILITINIVDKLGNAASTNFSFSTETDTIQPVIVPVSPAPNSENVDIMSSIVVNLIDQQTGILPTFTTMFINGQNISSLIIQNKVDTYNYTLTYTPVTNLDYLTTINVQVTCYDEVYNAKTYTYQFSTSDDIYPPTTPIISNSFGSTTNITNFELTGSTEYQSYLRILVNDQVVTTAYVANNFVNNTFNIPVNLDSFAPGAVTIQAIAIDQRGNLSPTSTPLAFTIEDKVQSISLDGVNISINIPAGAFNTDVQIIGTTVNNTNEDKAFKLAYSLDLRIVATSGNPTIQQYKPVTITITLPNNVDLNQKLEVFSYDPNTGKWTNTGITTIGINGREITFTTTHFTIFGVGTINNSTALSDYDIIIAPNPVKLDSEPVHFVCRTPYAGEVEVRIYSISGKLLTKFTKPLNAGLNDFTWDGENDFNYKIANGAYLVFVKITDSTGEYKRKLKLAVLN